MDNTAPQKEHLLLQKMVGSWTYEAEGTDEPKAKVTGSETVRSLGGFWVIAEGQGAMPDGTPASTVTTLGFHPETKRYVGTWIGSMMSYLWVYDGSVDGNTLNLDSDGPSMAGDGKMAKYRDAIEFVNDNHRILRSQILNEDGSWKVFIVTNYKRA